MDEKDWDGMGRELFQTGRGLVGSRWMRKIGMEWGLNSSPRPPTPIHNVVEILDKFEATVCSLCFVCEVICINMCLQNTADTY